MPTYDYRCESCGHEFEHFQGMSDPLLKTCPECKKRKLKRLIGAGAGLIFKGSGFYITDYHRDGYRQDAKQDEPGSNDAKAKPASDSGSAEKSGDAAPAAEKPKKASPPSKGKKSSKPRSKSS